MFRILKSVFLYFLVLCSFSTVRADDFENALNKTRLLAAASIQFHANLALIISEDDPIAAAEYVANVRAFRAEFEPNEDHVAEEEAFQKRIGLDDPDFFIRISGAMLHKNEERLWTFIQSVSEAMLKRLPRLKASRPAAQKEFVDQFLFELKYVFDHHLSNFQRVALTSTRKDLREFGQYLSDLKKKVDGDEKIPSSDIEKLILTSYEFFGNNPLLYDDICFHVELLEIYNTFQHQRTGKPLKIKRGSLLQSLSKTTEYSTEHKARIERKALDDSDRINRLDLKGMNVENIVRISKLQQATVNLDPKEMLVLSFGLTLDYFRTLGNKKLQEVQAEFMRGIPAGEFAPDTPTRHKPLQPRGKRPGAEKRGALERRKQGKGSVEEPDARREIKESPAQVTALLPSSSHFSHSSLTAATEPAESQLPTSMNGEMDEEGRFVSEGDLDQYLDFQSFHFKKAPRDEDRPEEAAAVIKVIRLSGKAARVFEIAAGLKFHEFQVENADFLALLNQLKGGVIRGTGKGKGMARQYAIPNLKDPGGRPHNFYHLHFAHGGRNLNPKTLRKLVGRDLEDSGYLNNANVRVELE